MKPYNWKTDYDWTDPSDEPVGGVDETIIDETELMLPKDAKGIDSLRDIEGQTAKSLGREVARFMRSGEFSREEMEDILIDFKADGGYSNWDSLHNFIESNIWGLAKGGRVGLLRGGDPEAPEMVEDELSTMELMQDQGIQ